MSTKGLTPQEIEYIPELFEGIQNQLDNLLLERRTDIFRELKSATQKAIETGEDCGKVEVKLKTVITSGGVVCGYKSSLEYVTQFKVKDESGTETFDPSAPDLFDQDGNASAEVKEGMKMLGSGDTAPVGEIAETAESGETVDVETVSEDDVKVPPVKVDGLDESKPLADLLKSEGLTVGDLETYLQKQGTLGLTMTIDKSPIVEKYVRMNLPSIIRNILKDKESDPFKEDEMF